jgi:hypothetical protein
MASIIFTPGPQGEQGIPGPPEVSGIAISDDVISGLSEGDTVAFKYVGGVLVPYILCSASNHKLTAGNGDFVNLNLAP